MFNRWNVEIKKDHFVRYRGGRNGNEAGEGFVASIDTRSDYAKAYGALLTVTERDGSMPIKVSADAVYESLGKMTIGPDFVVTQNPLTRIKKSKIRTQPSQASGLDPDERLIKRRRKTAAQPMRGVYANPLTRVSVTGESQRFHEGVTGPTKSPTGRLRTRRKTTQKAPAGFYANPADDLRSRVMPHMNYVVAGNDIWLACFPMRAMALEYQHLMEKAHPSRAFKTLPLD